MATKAYQYTQEGETGKFTLIHEDTPVMLKIAMLDSKKVCFYYNILSLYSLPFSSRFSFLIFIQRYIYGLANILHQLIVNKPC